MQVETIQEVNKRISNIIINLETYRSILDKMMIGDIPRTKNFLSVFSVNLKYIKTELNAIETITSKGQENEQ